MIHARDFEVELSRVEMVKTHYPDTYIQKEQDLDLYRLWAGYPKDLKQLIRKERNRRGQV